MVDESNKQPIEQEPILIREVFCTSCNSMLLELIGILDQDLLLKCRTCGKNLLLPINVSIKEIKTIPIKKVTKEVNYLG